MEAIILAGGIGSRLKHLTKVTPKPMLLIDNKPFLEILFYKFKKEGIKRVILSVGYKKDIIKNYFKNSFSNIHIDYSEENTPLQTGGAIKKALRLAKENNVFVINGDTFFNINLREMFSFYLKKNADITIALKQMKNVNRYGKIIIDKNNKILKFKEKSFIDNGYINGGVYLIKKNILNNEKDIFMFEEFLTKKNNIYGYKSNGYFIDIGILEDYKKAQKELIWL